VQFKTSIFAIGLLSVLNLTEAGASIQRAQSLEVFGAPLRWFSTDDGAFANSIQSKASELSSALDPDCKYREVQGGVCVRPSSPFTPKYQVLAQKIEKETSGAFRARLKMSDREVIDLGELSQGALLEEVARSGKKPWFAEFAGDVFISPGQTSRVPLGISNPLYPSVIYANVEMGAGWVFGASGPDLGAEVLDPRTGEPLTRSDFARVILLGHPSMNGARLDAWASALVVGGKDLLKKLWGSNEFRGKWAWIYFTPTWKIACSPNLVCDFADPSQRRIKVSW
jgi:hypothetical protein